MWKKRLAFVRKNSLQSESTLEHVDYFEGNFNRDESNNHPLKPSMMGVGQLPRKQFYKFAAVVQFFIHNLKSNKFALTLLF